MVARNISISYNEEAFNKNKSEPHHSAVLVEAEEGFIGEIMLNDTPDEKERKQSTYYRKKMRPLSLRKSILSNNKKKASKNDSSRVAVHGGTDGEGTLQCNDDDDDGIYNDDISLVSAAGTTFSKRTTRGRNRRQMREVNSANIRNTIRSKSPSILRRFRRRASDKSCSTLISDYKGMEKQQQPQDDDDKDPHESVTILNEDTQEHQIVLTADTVILVSQENMVNDLSNVDETCYSQFQPSLNHSLRAERSMFVNGAGDNVGASIIAIESSSLDRSSRMENNNIDGNSEMAEKPSRQFLKRDKTSSVVARRPRKSSTSKKRHSSVSPKRNHHPSTGTTTGIPKRNSSLPTKQGDEKGALTPRKREKSPKRYKCPQKERTTSCASSNGEKASKRNKDKKKKGRKIDDAIY